MTDNLSNNTNQRIFSAETPPKLNADYNRETEIENQIIECLHLSEREFAARLAIRNFKSENYLKGETLVYLLGLAQSENQYQIADSIAEKLVKITEKIVRVFLRKRNCDENFIEEAIGEMIGEMFTQILGRGERSYEFWEKNFYVALQRLTTNYLRKHGGRAKLTDTFSELLNAENETEFDFESNLPKYETLTIEEKLAIKEIIGKMSGENRLIFIRYHADEWTQEQIADALGITARTVRNRLKQIGEFLEDFRGRGEK